MEVGHPIESDLTSLHDKTLAKTPLLVSGIRTQDFATRKGPRRLDILSLKTTFSWDTQSLIRLLPHILQPATRCFAPRWMGRLDDDDSTSLPNSFCSSPPNSLSITLDSNLGGLHDALSVVAPEYLLFAPCHVGGRIPTSVDHRASGHARVGGNGAVGGPVVQLVRGRFDAGPAAPVPLTARSVSRSVFLGRIQAQGLAEQGAQGRSARGDDASIELKAVRHRGGQLQLLRSGPDR